MAKRFYPKIPTSKEIGHIAKLLNIINNSNMAHNKPITPAEVIEQKRILTNKAILFNFCNHFKDNSLDDLLNDTTFFKIMSNVESTLRSRVLQVAIEVTYNKRYFSEKTLQKFYENDFQIEDPFKVNQGLCDQSTLYTALIMKAFGEYFNVSRKDLVVNSTPSYINKDLLSNDQKKLIEYNQYMTGNTACDATIRERPFDLKDGNEIDWTKNHIRPIDVVLLKEKGYRLLSKFEQSLESQVKDPSSKLSNDARRYAKDILVLVKEKEHLSAQSIFEKIYQYTVTNQPPKDFRMPYILPVKKASIDNLSSSVNYEELAKVDLDRGHFTDVKAKNALESIKKRWDPELVKKANESMKGSLHQVLPIKSTETEE